MIAPDRLAVCSWSLQPTSADDLIDKVRQTGLSRVQLHLNPLASDDKAWADTSAKLKDAGFEVVSGMVECVGEDYSSIAAITKTGGVVPDETWPDTRDAMLAAADVAGQMGLRLVTFHAGFVPHDTNAPIYTKVVGRLIDVADIFGKAGCEVALETGQEPADALVGLLSRLDNIGVNFDPANMVLYGSGDPIDALAKLLPHVKQVHLKDATPGDQPGIDWGTEVPVGDGAVDWPAFVKLLDDAGYGGDCVLEREAGDDRVGDVRKGVAFISD
ncbi:MAG: sugar phosphate isomerase/epimerase family protein [Planctomycetota bacterium]